MAASCCRHRPEREPASRVSQRGDGAVQGVIAFFGRHARASACCPLLVQRNAGFAKAFFTREKEKKKKGVESRAQQQTRRADSARQARREGRGASIHSPAQTCSPVASAKNVPKDALFFCRRVCVPFSTRIPKSGKGVDAAVCPSSRPLSDRFPRALATPCRVLCLLLPLALVQDACFSVASSLQP